MITLIILTTICLIVWIYISITVLPNIFLSIYANEVEKESESKIITNIKNSSVKEVTD